VPDSVLRCTGGDNAWDWRAPWKKTAATAFKNTKKMHFQENSFPRIFLKGFEIFNWKSPQSTWRFFVDHSLRPKVCCVKWYSLIDYVQANNKILGNAQNCRKLRSLLVAPPIHNTSLFCITTYFIMCVLKVILSDGQYKQSPQPAECVKRSSNFAFISVGFTVINHDFIAECPPLSQLPLPLLSRLRPPRPPSPRPPSPNNKPSPRRLLRRYISYNCTQIIHHMELMWKTGCPSQEGQEDQLEVCHWRHKASRGPHFGCCPLRTFTSKQQKGAGERMQPS